MGVGEWITANLGTVAAVAVPVLGATGGALHWLLQGRSEKAYERGWDRVAELDEEVRLLRIALHRATRRVNVGLTVSEILSLAMSLPLEDRLRAVKQARAIAERLLGESQ
jgi:hypothetical protein